MGDNNNVSVNTTGLSVVLFPIYSISNLVNSEFKGLGRNGFHLL